MSITISRTRLIILIAVLFIVGIYGIAQGGPPRSQEEQPAGQAVAVPSGAVMFFNLSTCPDGWTELAAARGRYVVGMPAGGTLGATVGTALSDQENRPVGQHNHAASDSGHSHGITDPQHEHLLDNSGQEMIFNGGTWGDANGDPHFATDSGSPVSQKSATGITINTGWANISVGDAGSVAGTNAPYLQLLACQKE